MQIEILKSKVHRAVITEANLNYVGSLTLDEDLMDAANMIEHEKIHVVNVNNGERIETYLIKGPRGSGVVCLNGAAARRGEPGDVIIVISYAIILCCGINIPHMLGGTKERLFYGCGIQTKYYSTYVRRKKRKIILWLWYTNKILFYIC